MTCHQTREIQGAPKAAEGATKKGSRGPHFPGCIHVFVWPSSVLNFLASYDIIKELFDIQNVGRARAMGPVDADVGQRRWLLPSSE